MISSFHVSKRFCLVLSPRPSFSGLGEGKALAIDDQFRSLNPLSNHFGLFQAPFPEVMGSETLNSCLGLKVPLIDLPGSNPAVLGFRTLLYLDSVPLSYDYSWGI